MCDVLGLKTWNDMCKDIMKMARSDRLVRCKIEHMRRDDHIPQASKLICRKKPPTWQKSSPLWIECLRAYAGNKTNQKDLNRSAISSNMTRLSSRIRSDLDTDRTMHMS